MSEDAIELFLNIAAGGEQQSFLVKPVRVEAPARIQEPVELHLQARLDALGGAFGTVAGFLGKGGQPIDLTNDDGAKLRAFLTAGSDKTVESLGQSVEEQAVAGLDALLARRVLHLFENAV